MSIISSGFGSSANTTLGNSVRLRSGATAYLSRTFGTPTDNRKWTWSGWVKRGTLGSLGHLFSWYSSVSAHNYFYFYGNVLSYAYNNGTAYNLITSAVFRDPTAWYHVMLVVDTGQATASDRTKIYVNGIQQAVSGLYAPQDSFPYLNSATRAPTIGRRGAAADEYFDGYIHSICFVDGAALTPGSFATLDAETGQWRPKSAEACKAVVDAGGSNSFMLAFDDGTSLTTLGYDYSSKGNNWTGVNISLTAGITYDWVVDTPTSNYCTLSPVQPFNGTPSNGNLTVSGTAASAASTMRMPQYGKWYAEYLFTAIGSANRTIVIWNDPNTANVGYRTDGFKLVNNAYTAYGTSWGANVTIGVAVDIDNNQITFYRNGVAQTTLSYQFAGNDWYFAAGVNGTNGSDTYHVNFGQRPWTYTPPSGFVGLSTDALADPPIKNPKSHFSVVTYVGDGATSRTITGSSYTPDFIWQKSRTATRDHRQVDVARGANVLASNLTTAEAAYSSLAPTSSGFTVLAALNDNILNELYVAWLWKAGGTPQANNDGSITSQTSANPQAGFSIVTYTGTGATNTIGHGLGVPPKMIIVKRRTGGDWEWAVWHAGIAATEYLFLNSTAAKATAASMWGSTLPTSTVFTVGSASQTGAAANFVAYCFAEVPGFSKIGTYTNNTSTNGPFVYCGFKPAFVMIKYVTAGAADWMIFDSTRDTTNVVSPYVRANLNAVESSVDWVDFLANGFKIRNADASSATLNLTTGSGTFIFIAFAESPTKYANAR